VDSGRGVHERVTVDKWKGAGFTPRELVVVESLLEAIAEVLRPLQRTVGELKTKVAEVERQKGVNLADAFQGAHLAGRTYRRGDLVQRSRKTWLALVQTDALPGSSSDWREFPLGPERAG
jgi:hypothetical protein